MVIQEIAGPQLWQEGDGWRVTTAGRHPLPRARRSHQRLYGRAGARPGAVSPERHAGHLRQLATAPLSDNVRNTVVPDRQAISDTTATFTSSAMMPETD